MNVKEQRVVNTEGSKETKNKWGVYTFWEDRNGIEQVIVVLVTKAKKSFPRDRATGLNLVHIKYHLGIVTATVEAKWQNREKPSNSKEK